MLLMNITFAGMDVLAKRGETGKDGREDGNGMESGQGKEWVASQVVYLA
jgi:hypothetical protein